MRVLILLCAPIFFLGTGCASIHVPASHHIPSMEEKGDVHINGSFGLNGFGVQTGYAFTDNMGFVAGTNFGKVAIEADDNRNFSYFDAGFIYFNRVGNAGKMEFLGTVGSGRSNLVRSFDDDIQREAEGRYMKYSLQNNASYSFDNIDGGLSTRVSYINYFEYADTDTNRGDRTTAFVFEPALFTAFNYKFLTFESQFGYSIPLSEQTNLAFDIDLIRISLAVKFRFNSL